MLLDDARLKHCAIFKGDGGVSEYLAEKTMYPNKFGR